MAMCYCQQMRSIFEVLSFLVDSGITVKISRRANVGNVGVESENVEIQGGKLGGGIQHSSWL